MSFRTTATASSLSIRSSANWQACAAMAVHNQMYRQICQAKQTRVLRLTKGPGG